MNLKNKIYMFITFLIIVFMISLTGFYLNSHTHKTSIGSSIDNTKQVSSSSENNLNKKEDVKMKESDVSNPNMSTSSSLNESKPNMSSSSSLNESKPNMSSSSDKDSSLSNDNTKSNDTKYMSKYRYVYEAVGGDDLSVVNELTGVDIDTLAKENSISIDAVFKKGDRIFVP